MILTNPTLGVHQIIGSFDSGLLYAYITVFDREDTRSNAYSTSLPSKEDRARLVRPYPSGNLTGD
jgi:hypothetical protein